MATGTIMKYFSDQGFGFIKKDTGGEDVFFHHSKVRGMASSQIRQNIRVSYEAEMGPKGLRATVVTPIGESTETKQETTTTHTTSSTPSLRAYRFLNPYNFVRYLEQPRPEGEVLGQGPPPPHDRYLGWTGRITCEVEAVTPLFIADAEGAEEDPDHKGHHHYRFFRYEGRPALPATSLRGAIRSVFEAVTNSCFSVFEKDEEPGKKDRLEHRVSGDPGLVPARVVSIDDKKVEIEIFDCATMSPPVACNDYPSTVKSGVASAYLPRVLKGYGSHQKAFRERGIVDERFNDGDRVAALVNIQRRRKRNWYQWFEVKAIVPAAQHEQLIPGSNQRKVFGYLHVTGPNIENKHDERLFFRWDDRAPEPQKTYQPEILTFEASVVEEYNRMIAKYWDRHGAQVEELERAGWPTHKNALPHPSTFVREGRKLKEGDLVYCFADKWHKAHLCPVSMPRLPYRFPREELVPEHIRTCHPVVDSFEELDLCPACRVFGWVHANLPSKNSDALVAYAGRVRFSHGELNAEQNLAELRMDPVSLAILGSPKPTTTQFYLFKRQNDGDLIPDGEVNYDNKSARLRGRKYYRHFGDEKTMSPEQRRRFQQGYTRATDAKHDGKDDQNRTVREALRAGAKFTFTVDFENLAWEELGALLWSLELEPTKGMRHRLGYAKPLGFGSIKVTIKALDVLDVNTRYQMPLSEGGVRALPRKEKCITDFKKAMARMYGSQFENLANVRDLVALTGQPPDLPIHYPRPPHRERGRWVITPDPEGKNFEWFVGNKKRRESLEVAASERRGLPLMDRKGQLPEE